MDDIRVDDKEFIKQVDGVTYYVMKDSSGNGKFLAAYSIVKLSDRYVCTCPAFELRGDKNKSFKCKHIKILEAALDGKVVQPKANVKDFVSKFSKAVKKLVYKFSTVGSLRREQSTLSELSFLVDVNKDNISNIRDVMAALGVEKVKTTTSKIEGEYKKIPVRVYLKLPEYNWYLTLFTYTGDADHVLKMRYIAKSLGGSLSLKDLKVYGKNTIIKSEEDIYKYLGVKYYEPRKRTGRIKIVVEHPVIDNFVQMYDKRNKTFIPIAPTTTVISLQEREIDKYLKKFATTKKFTKLFSTNANISSNNIEISFRKNKPERVYTPDGFNYLFVNPSDLDQSKLNDSNYVQSKSLKSYHELLKIKPRVLVDGKPIKLDTRVNNETYSDILLRLLSDYLVSQMPIYPKGKYSQLFVDKDLGGGIKWTNRLSKLDDSTYIYTTLDAPINVSD